MRKHLSLHLWGPYLKVAKSTVSGWVSRAYSHLMSELRQLLGIQAQDTRRDSTNLRAFIPEWSTTKDKFHRAVMVAAGTESKKWTDPSIAPLDDGTLLQSLGSFFIYQHFIVRTPKTGRVIVEPSICLFISLNIREAHECWIPIHLKNESSLNIIQAFEINWCLHSIFSSLC